MPDDGALRLVVLSPEQAYLKQFPQQATISVEEYLRNHGSQPRHRANPLLFVAADHAVLTRLRDATQVALAWASIVKDVEQGRLNIDQNQLAQAGDESQAANAVLPRAARECFKWLLCPAQDDPAAARPTVESFPLNTTSGTAHGELERVCRENELVIETWSPIHLRAKLRDIYLKNGRTSVGAMAFWEDTLRYLYLPRLRSREVLAAVIRAGAASRDFFGTAYGQADGKYDGFLFGGGDASLDDTLLLIEPEAAARYAAEQKKLTTVAPPGTGTTGGETITIGPGRTVGEIDPEPPGPGPVVPAKAKSFHGSVEVNATLAKSKLNTIADEVIALLASDPNATVWVTLEIAANFSNGASDAVKRGVSENAASLGFKTKDWE